MRGLRLVHTHLKSESLTMDDLTDLVLLRLDYITAITIDPNGFPQLYYSAHINAGQDSEKLWNLIEKQYPGQLKEGVLSEIAEIENSLTKRRDNLKAAQKLNRAILVGVYLNGKFARSPESSMAELKELCRTAEIYVVDTFSQKRSALDASTVLGKGKIQEIILKAIQQDVELLVFDLELSPSQAKKISDFSDLKVIDRTQLILDIFAKNAKSRDGKLQVELAQLKYLKGRLSELDDNMSRLTGGIGGRGPGETKFEIGKRRVEDKIHRLENEIKSLRNRRELNRKRRGRNEIPVAGIVGYTNAGKSTLLNSLTNSEVIAENKLFATLDPTTRRIRFPSVREIIISDTVGFIHDLPPELSNAFKATLEELSDADLLLHVIDASNPGYKDQMQAVEKILAELDLIDIPRINVFNKMDARLEDLPVDNENSMYVSALRKTGLDELLDRIEKEIWLNKNQDHAALAFSADS